MKRTFVFLGTLQFQYGIKLFLISYNKTATYVTDKTFMTEIHLKNIFRN